MTYWLVRYVNKVGNPELNQHSQSISDKHRRACEEADEIGSSTNGRNEAVLDDIYDQCVEKTSRFSEGCSCLVLV
jgi:hypothetical protein